MLALGMSVLIAVSVQAAEMTAPSLARLQAHDDTPPVKIEADGTAVLAIPSPLKRKNAFARFDLKGPFDLSSSAGIEFDISYSSEIAFRAKNVLASGRNWKGYYTLPIQASERDGNGWRHVRLLKREISDFSGRPEGFGTVGILRFYFTSWDVYTEDATIRIRNLRLLPSEDLKTDAWVVDGDVTFPEMKLSAKGYLVVSRRHSAALGAAGLTVSTVRESDFPTVIPESVRLVVLPYNRHLPKRVQTLLDAFAARGGRIVFGRHQDKTFRKRMLANGSAVDLGFSWTQKSVAEMARAYGDWVRTWFPELARSADARLTEMREFTRTTRAAVEARRSVAKGFRVFLDSHNAWGPSRGAEPWEKSVRFAAEHGVTDLIVNFAWAAEADYASEVLAMTEGMKKKGDGLVECLAACRKYGVKLHAWRCCWTLGHHTPKDVLERLTNEDRFQRDWQGKVVKDWLCPNHPANHKMHVAAMVELAKKGVDGINYDFIRYNNPLELACFCANCRAAFERELGKPVARWPEDVRENPELLKKWGDFRCRTIGRGIREIAERVRRECPGVEISTTGGGDWKVCPRDWARGRDWATWARNGWVDFVFLMNYSPDPDEFGEVARLQRETEVGKAFLVPALGPSCWSVRGAEEDALRVLREVEILKRLGYTSLGLFEYDWRANGYLPLVWP